MGAEASPMQNLQIDLRVAELLASRLCHDLVSPVGAVNNGMELLEEDLDPDLLGDAVNLASGSARQASATLQFFRLAYGQAGRQIDLAPRELRKLAEAYLTPHKVQLDWQADAVATSGPDGTGKLLLNMIALALEALPRGGSVVADADLSNGAQVRVVGYGQGVALRPESLAAFNGEADVATLSPRSIQAYFTQLVAQRMGTRIEMADASGGFALDARLPI